MAPQRTNMREVADLAGVAMSSVSRVLSGHPDVSPAMRQRVMAAVESLGYQPDMLAQSLRRKETRSVGFVVSDISNPLQSQIALGAETALRAKGYSMLLTNSENDPALDSAHIRLFQQRRVDGLLLSLAAEDDPQTFSLLSSAATPIVLIDRELRGEAGRRASSVLSDHRTGMRDAVGHLLDLGHRRVGLILGQPMRFSRERLEGLKDAYAARGLQPLYTVVEGQLEPRHGRAATQALLDAAEPATAIVAGGNQLLNGALAEIQQRGLRVGADLSLVSCDEISLTQLYQPPIAVVRRDTRALGRHAAELLLSQLEAQEEDDQGRKRTTREPEVVLLPTEFVARPSCAPPADAA
ncbi:LacI family transcriptional regulator [Conexibacter arvalis]|uniref:LacI family transcriptional regulator n=2 Tax=Conexibacter arvalis TaxID=912552 RepID=A0A840IGR3_9ACTN|nr:LacI family transcriptional regulator [Conexibacter arvalis]